MCAAARPLPGALALRPSEVVSDSRLCLSGSSRTKGAHYRQLDKVRDYI